jgi:FkbM family methyltransferase
MRLAKRIVEGLTGLTIERYGDSAFTAYRKAGGAWFSLRAQLHHLLTSRQIDLVLDVGANKGQFGTRMRKIYGGTMVSFEPVSSAYDELSKAAATDAHWQVSKCALGSREEMAQINVYPNSEFSSLHSVNEYAHKRFASHTATQRTEQIAVRRLDSFLDESRLTGRTFLKLDTQGHDLAVFEGAGDAIKNVSVLLSEMSLRPIYNGAPHWTEAVRVYEQAGFSVVGMFPINFDREKIVEYDCLMARD